MAGESSARSESGMGLAPPQWTPRDVAGVLFRRKGASGTFFVAAAAVAVGYIVLAPEVYRSEAKLLVKIGRESVALDPTATTGRIISVARSRMNEINSELEILRSRDLARGVVDSIGAARILGGAGGDTPRRRARAVEVVIGALDISVVKDSNVIVASFEAGDPELAREALRKLLTLYLGRHIAVHRTSGSHAFFVAETEKRRARLAGIEEALCDLKNDSGIASLADEREIRSRHVGELALALAQTDAERAAAWARLGALISQVEGLPAMRISSETSGIPGTAVEAMRERLYELQLREHDLRTRYLEESIPVRQVRRKIEEAKTLLSREEMTRKEVTRELNTTRRDLELARCIEQTNVASLDATRRAQARALAEAAERVKAFNGTALHIERLARERELEEATFRKYSEKLEQARVDRALERERISNIGMVQPATLPARSVRPRKKLVLALGLLFGLTGGVGVAFIGEGLGRAFHSPQDLERRTGCAALAAVPYGAGGLDGSPGGRALRAFEELRERLLLVMRADGVSGASVGILSSDVGEGASTVATGLAVRLARGGTGPVLLTDACPDGGAVHRAFGLAASPGLGDVLAGAASEADAIAPSGIAGLDVLPAGKSDSGVPFAQHIAALGAAAAEWRKRYRFVVVDLPPLARTPAAARASAALDGAVLVVEAGRSPCEAFARTRDLIVKSGGRVLGAVLNKRRFPVPRWVYDRL